MGKTEILYEKIQLYGWKTFKKKKVRFENVYICSEW